MYSLKFTQGFGVVTSCTNGKSSSTSAGSGTSGRSDQSTGVRNTRQSAAFTPNTSSGTSVCNHGSKGFKVEGIVLQTVHQQSFSINLVHVQYI